MRLNTMQLTVIGVALFLVQPIAVAAVRAGAGWFRFDGLTLLSILVMGVGAAALLVAQRRHG